MPGRPSRAWTQACRTSAHNASTGASSRRKRRAASANSSGSEVGSAICPAIATANRSSAAPHSSPVRSHSTSRSTHAVTRQAGDPRATSTASPSPLASRATHGRPASSASRAICPSREDGSVAADGDQFDDGRRQLSGQPVGRFGQPVVLHCVEKLCGRTEIAGQQRGDAATRGGSRRHRAGVGRRPTPGIGRHRRYRAAPGRRHGGHPLGRRAHRGRPVPGLGRLVERPAHRPAGPPHGRDRPLQPATLPELRFVQQAFGLPEGVGRRSQARLPAPGAAPRPATATGRVRRRDAGSSRSVPATASSGPEPLVWIIRATAPQSSARA